MCISISSWKWHPEASVPTEKSGYVTLNISIFFHFHWFLANYSKELVTNGEKLNYSRQQTWTWIKSWFGSGWWDFARVFLTFLSSLSSNSTHKATSQTGTFKNETEKGKWDFSSTNALFSLVSGLFGCVLESGTRTCGPLGYNIPQNAFFLLIVRGTSSRFLILGGFIGRQGCTFGFFCWPDPNTFTSLGREDISRRLHLTRRQTKRIKIVVAMGT